MNKEIFNILKNTNIFLAQTMLDMINKTQSEGREEFNDIELNFYKECKNIYMEIEKHIMKYGEVK